MLPRSFYEDTSQVLPEKTATVTGVLPNPLDLVTSDRAWLTIKPSLVETSLTKKTLIFCDHLYKERDDIRKTLINRQLKSLQMQGFNILCLDPISAELNEWNGKDISYDYSADLQIYTKEFINSLAHKKNKLLSAGKIFQLDNFGLNEALNQPRGTIDVDVYEKNIHNLINLIASTQVNAYHLEFHSLADLATLNQLPPEIFSAFANKVVSINLEGVQLDAYRFKKYFLETMEKFPRLEKINFPLYDFTAVDKEELEKYPLKNLTEINFYKTKIVHDQLKSLFQSSNNLKKLTFRGMNNTGIFESPFLTKEQLQKIKEVNFSDTTNSAKDIESILTKMNSIESLILYQVTLNYDPKVSEENPIGNLTANSLPQLKNVYLTYLTWANGKVIENIFKAANNLEKFTTNGKSDISGAFVNLKKENLHALKTIVISEKTILTTDLDKILESSTQLEEIHLSSVKLIGNSSTAIYTEKLTKLKSVSFVAMDMPAATFTNLILAAPNLKTLRLFSCGQSTLEFTQPVPNSITVIHFTSTPISGVAVKNIISSGKLEEITINDCENITGGFENVRTELHQVKKLDLSLSILSDIDCIRILHSIPLIEELNLSACSGLRDAGIMLLPNLKKVDLSNTDIGIDDVIGFLKCCPNLTELNINFCSSIPKAMQRLSVAELRQLDLDKLEKERGLYFENPKNFKFSEDAPQSPGLAAIVKAINKKSQPDIATQARNKSSQPSTNTQATNLSSSSRTNTQAYNKSFQAPRGIDPDIGADDDYLKTTVDLDKTLTFTKYFKGINVSRYRIASAQPDLNSLKPMGKTLPDIFTTTKLVDKNNLSNSNYTFEDGSKTVTAKDGNIITLPSIEPTEKLFQLKVINEKGETIELGEDAIKYSKNSRFYQIVLPKAGNYTIDFKLALENDKPKLPYELTQIINKYNNYGIAKKEAPNKFNSLQESVDYIKKNECGACRLRALAAYADLKATYKEKVQIIYNDVHAFVEVNDGNKSYTLDLGGYPGQLKEIIPEKHKEIVKQQTKVEEIKPEIKNKPAVKEQQKTPEALIAKDTKKTEEAKETKEKKEELETKETQETAVIEPDDITIDIDEAELAELKSEVKPEIKLKDTTTTLALCSEDSSFQQYLTTLNKESGNPDNILVLHRPEDINISSMGITPEGNIVKEHTALNMWLQNHTEGTLLVDIRNFNAAEIAQLNDLLDRRVEEKQIPAGIRIILLDKSERGYYGPDFRRRVPKQESLQSNDTPLLSPSTPQDLPNAIVIDLYDSPFWKNILAGSWELVGKDTSNELSFQWKKEQLLNLALNPENKGKQVIFKNAPLNDPTFREFVVELQSLKRFGWADQVTPLPEGMSFYQSSGYDWSQLAKSASLELLTGTEDTPPYILSDTNILSFVHDIAYEFSQQNQLESKPSYLERAKASGAISIFVAPGTAAGTVANLLEAANKKNIAVKFVVPSTDKMPANSPLNNLNLSLAPEIKDKPMNSPLTWELHEDVYLAAQLYRANNPKVTTVDLSSLEASELSRFAKSAADLRDHFLATGKFKMEAPLSAILTKLKNGETVMLTGQVPTSLYAPLAALATGQIEGERFSGKLVLLTSVKEAAIATALTGLELQPILAPRHMKEAALNTRYPGRATEDFINFQNNITDFATLERDFLQHQLKSKHKPLTSNKLLSLDDEARAKEFDQSRVNDINNALQIRPWVMIEGSTGIGKSAFLHGSIPGNQVTFDLEEWLTSKPANGKNATLVVDEANFMSQLSGLGDNFAERFQGLNDKPPGFFYKGVHHKLTSDHKVIFAFNKATYGAGRTAEGFLSDHGLFVKFLKLPDFYLRARIIKPMLNNIFENIDNDSLRQIAAPIINIYNWILTKNPDDSLITPREIKAMVNLVASEIIARGSIDSISIYKLSSEIAYQIGKQTLNDNADLLKEFKQNFEPHEGVLNRRILPNEYIAAQQTEYEIIQNVLQARSTVLNATNTDLGLGGILLDGSSGIGKTHFINQIKIDFENKTGEKTYRISPSTPYYEKESILLEAFEKGAIVIAEEFNTSLWPNKLLNNLLMGLDKDGNPSTHPGFLLLATQNPPSFEGRADEDPAMRRRFIKFELDWPVFDPKLLLAQKEKSANEIPTPPVPQAKQIATPPPVPQNYRNNKPPPAPEFYVDEKQVRILTASIKTMLTMIKQIETNYTKVETGSRKKNDTKLKILIEKADKISAQLNSISESEDRSTPAKELSKLREISTTTIRMIESSFKDGLNEWLSPLFKLAMKERTVDGFIDRLNNEKGHHFNRMAANVLRTYYEANPTYPADPNIRSLVTKIKRSSQYTFSHLKSPDIEPPVNKPFKLK